MKELPYFLLLIKKNALLWTIITTNSFANINLEGAVHGFWSSQSLELRDYSLNKGEKFKSIRITNNDSNMMLDFYTDSDKYIKNANYYFGEALKNQDTSSVKRFEKFDIGLDMPINVEITNYGDGYGTVIGITVHKKN